MRPARRRRVAGWVLVSCPKCFAQLQLRRIEVEGRDLTPWTAPVGNGRLPCPFCLWGEDQSFHALELEPPRGEPRRCFFNGKALHGPVPARKKRTAKPEQVGCRKCRGILAREALAAVTQAAHEYHLSEAGHPLPLGAFVPGAGS